MTSHVIVKVVLLTSSYVPELYLRTGQFKNKDYEKIVMIIHCGALEGWYETV